MAPNSYGYGRFRYDGKTRYAHRLSWQFMRGDLPDDLTIDHLCRNRMCINPDHLEPVSLAENGRRGGLTPKRERKAKASA